MGAAARSDPDRFWGEAAAALPWHRPWGRGV
ncbi:MAG: acetyl-coenzyme A synthetase N-terminal domain-containing protein [Candidatus Dormibacterales bacterium]